VPHLRGLDAPWAPRPPRGEPRHHEGRPATTQDTQEKGDTHDKDEKKNMGDEKKKKNAPGPRGSKNGKNRKPLKQQQRHTRFRRWDMFWKLDGKTY
jgi:hypothetical protein